MLSDEQRKHLINHVLSTGNAGTASQVLIADSVNSLANAVGSVSQEPVLNNVISQLVELLLKVKVDGWDSDVDTVLKELGVDVPS